MLKVERGERTSGMQYLRATVLANTGRILGVAELQIPLLPGFTLAGRIGPAGSDAIEQAALDLAIMIADAVQFEPSPQ